jgi:hypothetical protein
VREIPLAQGRSLLVAVAADGAGSAERGREGARIACETVVELADAWARAGRHDEPTRDLSAFERADVGEWIGRVRSRIEQAMLPEGREVRDFSCTLVVALVDDARAVFFQIGDGALVYRVAGDRRYSLAFWPQLGEYANLTRFVTDGDALEQVQFAVAENVDEVALLTDGLQGLALRFASREAHGPFFDPMFERLRGDPDQGGDDLSGALVSFLESPAVNQRTDDDKTLVLATRLGPEPGPDPRPEG